MIESIKKQGKGWLVNGNKSVPNDERNTDCQEVLAYIAEGGVIEDEFTAEELLLQAQTEAKAKREIECNFLSWRFERHARETRLSVTLTDDLAVLDTYIQQLADMTSHPDWDTDPLSTVDGIIAGGLL